MLSIPIPLGNVDRRSVLAGGLCGAMSLANSYLTQARGGTGQRSVGTGKSVIFLFQHGGPTQFETFDPKVDVSDGIRTVGGTLQTSLPGVSFGATMRRLSKWAHRMAVVRSFATASARHSLQPLIGSASRGANIGTLYSRLAGSNDPESGLPSNVTLFPNTIDPRALGPDERFGKFSQTGGISSAFAPFTPGSGSTIQENMTLRLPTERFTERVQLLARLDGLRAAFDPPLVGDGVDKYRRQAFEMVTGGVADAFDLSQEDPRTVARYDTGRFVDEERYSDVNNGGSSRRWYQNNAHTLGKELLLARRLCEAGCRFVTVATRFVWDMHADQNNVGLVRGMEAVGRPFDHAVSAFIEDCEERGLHDKILLVCVGEMGRTPRINKNGGRDHWARLAPLMMYGGGITDGQIIGQSTRDGGEPLAESVDSANLVATILHTLLDASEVRLRPELPSDLVNFLADTSPIPHLF